MSRPRKFRPGAPINSLLLLVHLIEAGGDVCFYWAGGDRPKSSAILRNMSLDTLALACKHGRVRVAERVAP